MVEIIVIPAKTEHAEPMIKIIRASITELCAEDHKTEPEALNDWLSNKTVDNMRKWIAEDDKYMLVAMVKNEIAGMGCANKQGRILMNYVSPNYRFIGISKAIMNGLEVQIRALGIKQASLESSKTALKFYLSCGWQLLTTDDGKIEMVKIL